MLLKEYLENPCEKSSLPYWKTVRIATPENMKIVHQKDFDETLLTDYTDERYFRLIRRSDRPKPSKPNGFRLKTAQKSDLKQMAEIINQSYTDCSVNEQQLLFYTETPVYDPDLWIVACDRQTERIVGCAIADLDSEIGEGVLEWSEVLPQYRGKGIGRLMVNELLSRMEKADFVTVSGKMDGSSRPEGFYRKCGFAGNDIWHILRRKT